MGSIKVVDGDIHVVFDADELADLRFYQKQPSGEVKWIDKMSTALYVAAMAMIKKYTPKYLKSYSRFKIDGKGTITVILEE